MNKKKITAVIPVKENSSRLIGKNFLPFGGFNTLLENKIDQLLKCEKIDNILITSDSMQAKSIANNMGIEFDHRPIEFANETRPLSDFFRYIANKLNSEHMLWACVTSPLIDHVDYNEIINKYYESLSDGFDSIITVTEFKHYILDSKGPLNYKLGEAHSNSQDLPSLDLFTNGALICPVDKVIEWGYNYGPKHFRYRISQSKSIDIDTKWDYLTAKAFHMEILNLNK